MKKVAMVLALLLSIGMISCDDNADKPAETGTNTSTTASSIKTYETTSAETTESTVMTTAGTNDYVDISTMLNGIDVYNIHYNYKDNYKDFDEIFYDMEEKFQKGESVPNLYAYKFIEYPDIAIVINNIVNNSSLSIGISKVIYKGQCFETVEFKNGIPSFQVYLTNEILCIATTASFTGDAYFFYNDKALYQKYPDALDGKYPSFYMEDDILKYSCISSQYSSAIQWDGYYCMYYISNDDYYTSDGTIKLIDNEIVFAEAKSYTIAEWYELTEQAKYLRTESGCDTFTDYLNYLKNKYEITNNNIK